MDGDGVVNDRDYFLGKHFDADGDGRLNTAEKQTAMNEIEKGFETKYLWGLESTGGLKDHVRVL